MSSVYTQNQEAQIIEALRIYYENFGNKNSVTFNYACRQAGVKVPEVVDYIADHKGLGMPDDQEEALEYLCYLDFFQ